MDKITADDILLSLNPELNRQQVFKAKESAGKSGSFFFFSFDRRFLIKTMNNAELKVFRNCLPDYVMFLRENPDSMIARIYGVFTVQMEDITPVHLLLMSNAAQAGKNIKNVFDLKGSIINRKVEDHHITAGGTLKDVNLLDLKRKEIFLRFQRRDKVKIMRQIHLDINFMQKFMIMDYSLLLIVEENPDWTSE